MTSLTIARRWLADHWRLLMGWCIGVAIPPLLYLSMFKSVSKTDLMQEKMKTLPPELRSLFKMDDVSSPAGFTQATVFGLMGMVLCLIALITVGSRMIAGEEEQGTLELDLSHQVTRSEYFAGKVLALVAVVTALVGVLTGMTLVMARGQRMDLPANRILAAGLGEWLLVLGFGLVGLCIGAATGKRSLTLGLTTAVAAASYFAHSMGDKLASWVPKLSPMHWAFGNEPLKLGPGPLLWWFLPVFAVLLFVGSWRFSRRDLGV